MQSFDVESVMKMKKGRTVPSVFSGVCGRIEIKTRFLTTDKHGWTRILQKLIFHHEEHEIHEDCIPFVVVSLLLGFSVRVFCVVRD
jgi:hypothetical protein